MQHAGQMQHPGYLGTTWFVLNTGQSELARGFALVQALSLAKFDMVNMSRYSHVACPSPSAKHQEVSILYRSVNHASWCGCACKPICSTHAVWFMAYKTISKGTLFGRYYTKHLHLTCSSNPVMTYRVSAFKCLT